MKTDDERRESWQQIGRAAEQFARQVARDAAEFATQIEGHVGALAGELRREWRSAEPSAKSSGAADDVRRVFDDVRGVLSAVVDGVDELITAAFSSARGTDEAWTRVTTNRDAACGACARPIAAGTEAFARRHCGSHEFRCDACGAPGAETF